MVVWHVVWCGTVVWHLVWYGVVWYGVTNKIKPNPEAVGCFLGSKIDMVFQCCHF